MSAVPAGPLKLRGAVLGELTRLLDRRWTLVKGVAVLVGLAVLASGSGVIIEQLLRGGRDVVRMQPASGEIVIVEIDARSQQGLAQWPWPRRYHAALIDRLTQSGARTIAFDATFSVRSTDEDDRALAAALERAGGTVILPTYRELAGSGSSDIVENLPLQAFAQRSFLAGVNVVPDPDGYVRHIPLGTETAGVPRPSLASMVAEGPGEIDGMLEIDFATDPSTIPRFSFIDVMQGRVDAEALRGKRVIIGATAIDIVDRYAVPVHGVIPGVVIQALAAETMLGGRLPGTGSAFWPLLLAVGVIAVAVRKGNRVIRAASFAGGTMLLLALPLVTEELWAVTFPIVPALAVLAFAGAATLVLHFADRLRIRTFTDVETGLPNLAALVDSLARDGGVNVVVARVERFAAISAGLGPAVTVTLVQRIADRLAIGAAGPVYRIDEHSLAWTVPDGANAELEDGLAALAALMRTPVECGRLVDATLAFGIAPPCGAAPKQQVANAALAAERAAREGRVWTRFAGAEGEETDWHLSMLGELEAAMAAGEVWNAYQPKFDIATGRICGAEALVRWNHAERGPVGPDQFIPLVEAHGRAADLTIFVFKRALADAALWRSAGHDLSVAVNVSATLLGDRDFVSWLREALAASPVPPERVTIEVTESAAMRDADSAAAALAEWRALGVNVSIDDYGTGQSSLGYLQRLPATELKIDKSFVQSIAEDSRNAIMVRSTIALAHQLGMKTVAEGVEDAACLALLKAMECDVAQGWHIGKPMPSNDFEALVADRAKLAA